MRTAIKRMHVVETLPNGKMKVHGMEGEFTPSELDTLKRLISSETGGHMWII